MTPTGLIFFCNLILNGALHDTKMVALALVWAGAKKYKFLFLLYAGPLRDGGYNSKRIGNTRSAYEPTS